LDEPREAEIFLRRIVEHLKTQNWTAVGLDLGIVVVGVFIGTQVSNWNQERLDRRDTERLLLELRPALQSFDDYYDTAKDYYATTHAYSDTAFAGWSGDPSVSDEQFVVAAYQASQIYTFDINGENWASIFGGDRMRDIDDIEVRRGLTNVMTFTYEQIDLAAVATPYRVQVRRVIPVDVQDAIRAQCTDKPIPGRPLTYRLPVACDLDLPEERFAVAAAALRAQPELVGELTWHRAAIAAFLVNLGTLNGQTKQLQGAIERTTSSESNGVRDRQS
jgi:hypothetical protein